MKHIPKNIIISRTDSIGDVVLTLPVAAVLKKNFPEMKVAFMGKSYTKAVIESSVYIDQFIDVDEFMAGKVLIDHKPPQAILHELPVPRIAWQSLLQRIPLRIGTTNRLYHWGTCNLLVPLSRRNSVLHESQLNIKLLKPLGINTDYTLAELGGLMGIEKLKPLKEEFQMLTDKKKYNLIFHPKSQGSGREWPQLYYAHLLDLIDPDQFKVFVSGTEKERSLLQPFFDQAGDRVTDIMGKMDLGQFISFIHQCDGMVASGTGPLHLAAALGKDALGIYPPIRPIHPGRWQPLGPRVHIFVMDKVCNACTGNPEACECMRDIKPNSVHMYLESLVKDPGNIE